MNEGCENGGGVGIKVRNCRNEQEMGVGESRTGE